MSLTFQFPLTEFINDELNALQIVTEVAITALDQLITMHTLHAYNVELGNYGIAHFSSVSDSVVHMATTGNVSGPS